MYVICSFTIATEHASVYPSASTSADGKDDPDLPPYDPSYWNTDVSTNSQSTIRGGDITLVPPPNYSSVVSSTTTVPLPPATDS